MNNIYKTILDSIEMPMLYCDINHTVQYLNPAAEHYYYVIRGCGDLIGKSLFDCHKVETKKKIIALVEQLKSGKGEMRTGTAPITGHRAYLMPVRDENGSLLGYIKRFEDNTHK